MVALRTFHWSIRTTSDIAVLKLFLTNRECQADFGMSDVDQFLAPVSDVGLRK